MRTRSIGSLEVSLVGLGCNNFGRRIGPEDTQRVVDAAIEAGITFFDTADVYGDGESERFLGQALGSRRDEVLVATKFGHSMGEGQGGGGPAWVRRAIDDSLRRLDVEHVDLYQLHRPDPEVPIEETLGALDELVTAGKVREIGCSNFSADQLDDAVRASEGEGRRPFVSVQNRYSVLTREPESDGVAAACERHDLALIPYFPLESGLLTGKYSEGFETTDGRLVSMSEEARERFASEAMLEASARLTELAQRHGRTVLELSMSWLARQPAVSSVIAGATQPEQVRANAGAADWELDAEQLREIDHIVAELGPEG